MFNLFILYAEFTINEINIAMAITIQLTSLYVLSHTAKVNSFLPNK